MPDADLDPLRKSHAELGAALTFAVKAYPLVEFEAGERPGVANVAGSVSGI